MRSLDDDLEDLTELDGYRMQSAEWRDAGRWELANRKEWQGLDAPLSEYSVTVRALRVHQPDKNLEAVRRILAEQFDGLEIDRVFDAKPDDMPILRAARIMHALLSGPASPFNRITMWCYYRIVREFHSAHAPEWITGGARTGDAAAPTAYATGECVRAVTALGDALDRLAVTLSTLATVADEWERLKSAFPVAWRNIEARRLAHQLVATLEPHRANDIVQPQFPRYPSSTSINFDEADGIIESALAVETTLLTTIEAAKKEFDAALKDIEDFRTTEEALLKELKVHTISAHQIARGAIERAVQTTMDARKAYLEGRTRAERLRKVSDVLRESASRTRRVVRPAIAFLSRVVDHELAAAASDDSAHCDVPELAFAASSYGAASGLWHDERLRRAAGVLASRLSERGHFPFGRPLRPSQYGYKAHAIGSETLRAFSQILEKVPGVEAEPRIVKRMMMYFHDMRVDEHAGLWHQDDAPYRQPPQRWSTAFGVIALDQINRMLDQRINERVLKHFSWRKVTKLGLEELFYPDYGLVHHRKVKRDSLAVILERMRAHVAGVPRHYDQRDAVYSLILHGPGGTGKTTMVEALAKSADVPLVEVTPSDIVIGGADAIERRTRAVFKALSLLTRVVILFDEFDPILQARDPHATGPASVFSFLTPGMLPKLKTLHEDAKKRAAAYILNTNLIGKLDTAAIREGRFDVRAGVYPPDLLSRVGRLYSMLDRHYGRTVVRGEAEESRLAAYDLTMLSLNRPSVTPEETRVRYALVKTRGMSMNTLGRPGWYSAPPSEARSVEDVFGYIGGEKDIAARRIDDEPKINGAGEEAVREWQEWSWVEAWDDVAENMSTIEKALDSPPDAPQPAEETFDFENAAAHCENCRHSAQNLKSHSRVPPPEAKRRQPHKESPPS